MKKQILGVAIVLSLAFSIPVSNVQAGFIDDVSSWVQTSFFGPKIFGGWGKSKKDYVPTAKTAPARTKTIKSLGETADHPVMRTYTAPQRTYSAPMTTKSSTSGVAVGRSCNAGLCCEDSDGGIDRSVKGTTVLRFKDSISIKTFTDEKFSTGVIEYYCTEGARVGMSYAYCQYGGAGAVCYKQDPEETSCTDTDGGKNPYEKGTVVTNGVSKTDGCVTSELVAEWFCADGFGDSDVMECDNGCNNGACIVGTSTGEDGTLAAEMGTTVYSDILVSGQTDVEVMKVRLRAMDGDVTVKELIFAGAYGPSPEGILDFKLYDQSGRLIQEKQMVNSELVFSLSSQDQIVIPSGGSTQVTIKVDVRQIAQPHQSGNRLALVLQTAVLYGTKIQSQDFVIYKSELSVKHATSQPSFQDPAASHQEMYRFTVTADSSNSVELGKLTFDVNLQGMSGIRTYLTKEDFQVLQVKSDGTLDGTARVATISRVSNASNTSNASKNSARVNVDFINQKFDQRETRTYALLVGYLENSGQMSNDDDSVAVSIVRDEDFFASGDRNTVWGWNDIVWSDEADSNHSDITKDWHNGYLVDIDSAAQVNRDSSSGGNTGGSTTPKTTLSISNATTQPKFIDPSMAMQEMYRFTVKADSAGPVQLGKMTLVVNLQGMKKSSGNWNNWDFKVLQIKSDGTVDDTANVATISQVPNASATSAGVEVNFSMVNLSAGESRTFTLLIGGLVNDSAMIADDDVIAISLRKDTQESGPGPRSEIGDSYIVWSDKSASGHSDTTSDWYNGDSVIVYGPMQVNHDGVVELACVKEGEMTAPGSDFTGEGLCCDGSTAWDVTPETSPTGEAHLCYSTAKGNPTCENAGTGSEGWYQGGQLLRAMDCAEEEIITMTCTDTDKGLNYYTKGSAYLTGGLALPVPKSDVCLDKTVLEERYCLTTSTVGKQTYKCEFGCSNGACKTKSDVIVVKPIAPLDLAGNKIWHLSWSNQWVYAKGYCQLVKGKTTYESFKTARTSEKVCRCDGSFGCKGESCTSNQEYYTEIICK